jgi:hypothetical protein
MLSFFGIHTGLHALILLPKPHTLGVWVYTLLVMLSHVVMSVVQVFHPLWCWVWLVYLWECCGLPSSRCDLAVVRIDVVVWAMVGMVKMVNTIMHVVLESAKDRILWVDPPWQHVPPCIWYGTACLLIRNAIGCVSCSVEWEWHHTLWQTFLHTWTTLCERGCLCGKP